MTLLLLVLVSFGVANQIIPPPCPLAETKLQCVGADEDCHADVRTTKVSNSNFPNTCPVGGTCKVCGDDSLVCSATQVCVRRSAGVGSSCSTTTFCLPHLRCNSGACVDPTDSWVPPGQFAQNGEACNPANGNGDCLASSGLICNALTNKCDLPSTISTVATCNSHIACPAGQYCSQTNNYGGPVIGRTCKPAIPLSSRAGTLCVTGASGQCGWTFNCVPLNPAESTGQFARSICVEYYSIPSGQQASAAIYCQSGRISGTYCIDPDYSTLGDACSPNVNTECGNFATCGCPIEGGSRYRCVKAGGQISTDFAKAEYFRQKPYLDCLESHGCHSLTPLLGSCGWKNCRQHLQGLTLTETGSGFSSTSAVYTVSVPFNLDIWPNDPTCDAFYTEGVTKYKGWKEIESGASVAQLSVSAFAVVVALAGLLL